MTISKMVLFKRMLNELIIYKCIENLKGSEDGVLGGEAAQVSPKLGNLLSRLFPDTTNTPLQ